jgi:hypothetical protein
VHDPRPNGGAVFEEPRHLTLVHVMSKKLITCPACGKSAMRPADVKDPVTGTAQAT